MHAFELRVRMRACVCVGVAMAEFSSGNATKLKLLSAGPAAALVTYLTFFVKPQLDTFDLSGGGCVCEVGCVRQPCRVELS